MSETVKKDKHGTILAMGNKVKDKQGKVWKLQHFNGVAMLMYPVTGKTELTKVLRKVDFSQYEKED